MMRSFLLYSWQSELHASHRLESEIGEIYIHFQGSLGLSGLGTQRSLGTSLGQYYC